MPSISLANLGWSTPDGQPLFQNLNLTFSTGRTGLVGRNGVGKSTLLKLIAGSLPPATGDVLVHGMVGMLRQTVQIDADTDVGTALGCAEALARLDRLERGIGDLADAEEADWLLPGRIATAFADVGLPELAMDRAVASLSGGQRTRLALATLLVEAPDIALFDEPTNNLDGEGRVIVADVLARWRGMAIVVSHERSLLRQMDDIVELTTLGATTYGGNWDDYAQRKAIELAAVERDLVTAERHLSQVERRSQVQAERKARRDGAGARKAARGGMPKILIGGMKRRAEETGAAQARLANRMQEQAEADAASARERVEVLQPFSVALAPSGLPAGRLVLQADAVSGGYDPDVPLIEGFSLTIVGPERLAITGVNGSGKSTLLKLLIGALAPSSGVVRLPVSHAVLDQSVSLLDPAETIRDNYRRLNPEADENACRAALARFKFRADAALQLVGTLSGGELLRAGLAATIGSGTPPQLLILDEPTNHLDIEAIAAVEAGLSAYDGALLVVSHDRDFLEAIGVTREIALS